MAFEPPFPPIPEPESDFDVDSGNEPATAHVPYEPPISPPSEPEPGIYPYEPSNQQTSWPSDDGPERPHDDIPEEIKPGEGEEDEEGEGEGEAEA
ncbi:hypothetical protein [Mycobacterium sp. 4858]|uniref:hypothetical protein n=1 Tax=Mycobacterium sp. 4858 TaxID=2057185 RepID=UPI00115B2715|nr:hypothetical protein [Mycobacterium sp. 4858]